MAGEGYWGSCRTHRITFILAFVLLSSLCRLIPSEMPIFRKDHFCRAEEGLLWVLFVLLQRTAPCARPSLFLADSAHNFMLLTMAKMYFLILPHSQGREMRCGLGWGHTQRSIREVMQKKILLFSCMLLQSIILRWCLGEHQNLATNMEDA